MINKEHNELLTQKLEELFSQESNAKTDKEIFNLAIQLVKQNQSNYIALYILAQCYHFGIGTSVNLKKAIKFYEILSKNPYCENLNFQYKYANALEQTEDILCLFWYLQASLNGDQYSTYRIGHLMMYSELMTDIPYIERYKIATKFIEKSIKMDIKPNITKQAINQLHNIKTEHHIKRLKAEKQNNILESLKKFITH